MQVISSPFRLETERLILRAFQDADIDAFAAYRSDPQVARYQSWSTPYSREQASAFITEMSIRPPGITGDWFQIALELKSSGELIGDCAFHILVQDSRQAEIGFTLARPFQGQGFAFEAVQRLFVYLFGELGLHRVVATCDIENIASMRLLERLGMRREAHFVENIWFKGSWGSEYMYAILKREWNTAH
jgi:aminoglycoside 6'-N-acetyltransferase